MACNFYWWAEMLQEGTEKENLIQRRQICSWPHSLWVSWLNHFQIFRNQGSENLFAFGTTCFLRQILSYSTLPWQPGTWSTAHPNQLKDVCWLQGPSLRQPEISKVGISLWRFLRVTLFCIEWVPQTDQMLDLYYPGKRGHLKRWGGENLPQ